MVRVGIIGAGLMGRRHAATAASSPNVTLMAVAAEDETQAREVAKTHDIDRCATADELIERDDIDAVIIATPTDTHAYLGLQAVAAGKHVFVEKPIARTSVDARRLVEAAGAAGVILQVGHVIRYFPEYQAIKRELDTGKLGTPATATLGRRCAQPDWAPDRWHQDMARGGGAMFDMMIHDIDLVRWYFGEPETVFARAVGSDRWSGVDYSLATLTLADGPICHLHASWAEPDGFSQQAEIACSNGMIDYDSRTPFDTKVARHDNAGADVTALPEPEGYDPFLAQLHDFAAAIEGGDAPMGDGDWALRSLELVEALLDSNDQRTAITMSEWTPSAGKEATPA